MADLSNHSTTVRMPQTTGPGIAFSHSHSLSRLGAAISSKLGFRNSKIRKDDKVAPMLIGL